MVAVLLAMGAMLMTAISYGRMANRYPAAGSAYIDAESNGGAAR